MDTDYSKSLDDVTDFDAHIPVEEEVPGPREDLTRHLDHVILSAPQAPRMILPQEDFFTVLEPT